jgi:hypothetical protein
MAVLAHEGGRGRGAIQKTAKAWPSTFSCSEVTKIHLPPWHRHTNGLSLNLICFYAFKQEPLHRFRVPTVSFCVH